MQVLLQNSTCFQPKSETFAEICKTKYLTIWQSVYEEILLRISSRCNKMNSDQSIGEVKRNLALIRDLFSSF